MVDTAWLERHGIFQRPAPNVTKSATIDWKTCLRSTQHIMRYDIYVVGTKAPAWISGEATPN
ncbi:hypothetical protein QEN58_03715 [Halomonas alkaliantarctica]|uniref:Uncharacterized protein n=1 Tax=Halomonas alkaliantarctica TaxID=232346 RepID=A0ABY8LP27_9GAMM|nr:hypothetical protein [Halomonas alkaliantarctica]WGI26175.1 hypothetical protein QEN58_03715 [Halomonas alkaliantarctica]